MFNNKDRICTIEFANETLHLLGEGALFWPSEKTLIVSDLHLEKGSYFAQKGSLLPHYDTRDTLMRLEQLITTYQPEKVISLGDNFHDCIAIERMHRSDYQYLCELNQKAQWLWVIGNHDKNIAHELFAPFRFEYSLKVKNIVLAHELIPQAYPQIIGHFHPKMTLNILEQKISGKCFVVSEKLIVMPAFGSYTGGLDIQASFFQNMLGEQKTRYFFLKKNKIWKIAIAPR